MLATASEPLLDDLLNANAELADFSDFCGLLTTQQRKPLQLEWWQAEALVPYFNGCTESVLIMPKKNGKSTIIAALALFHAWLTHLPECIVVANSVEQAKYIYGHMRKFIASSPELQMIFDVKHGTNEIRKVSGKKNADDGIGRIRVFAANEDSIEGVEPTLAIIDEYGKQKTSGVYGALNDGLDTRNGQLVVISNAPGSDLSPLGLLRENAYKWNVTRRGKYRFAMNDEGSACLHEWAVDPDDDWQDIDEVLQASPASWITRDVLERRFNSPQFTVSRWKRYTCGLTVPDGETAIQPEEWDALKDIRALIPAGSKIVIGWDQGWKAASDQTALVPVWWKSETERIIGDPIIFNPADPNLRTPDGTMLDDRHILEAFKRLSAHYDVHAIAYDPSVGAQHFAQTMKRDYGFKFAEVSQKPFTLAKCDTLFMEAVRQRTLKHNGNKALREHVLNAVEKTVGDQIMFDRDENGPRKPTDGLRAASMAHFVAYGENTAPKKRRGAQVF